MTDVENKMDKSKIQYKVASVCYWPPSHSNSRIRYIGRNEPLISLFVKEITLAKEDGGKTLPCILMLYLNKSKFNKVTNCAWDGTYKDCERIKNDLEGKIFALDLGVRGE